MCPISHQAVSSLIDSSPVRGWMRMSRLPRSMLIYSSRVCRSNNVRLSCFALLSPPVQPSWATNATRREKAARFGRPPPRVLVVLHLILLGGLGRGTRFYIESTTKSRSISLRDARLDHLRFGLRFMQLHLKVTREKRSLCFKTLRFSSDE